MFQEAVNEKINKNKGNSTEFSDWLQLEIRFFNELLVEIKRLLIFSIRKATI